MDYRQRIVTALKELAVTRGFFRVTVDELADQAGISKRTIYRYFAGKEEIIKAVVTDFMSGAEQKIHQALASSADPLDKIQFALKVLPEHIRQIQPLALYDLQKYYPHLWEEIERFRAAKIQMIYESLLNSDDRGRFRQVDSRIFTTALLASVRAVVNPAFIMENNLNIEETIESIFTIFLHGVVKEK